MIATMTKKVDGTPSKRCVAFAYKWVLTPVDFTDYDIALVIGCYDSGEKGEPQCTSYHARLPKNRSVGRQMDVSGNIGIIFPVSDSGTEQRATASERLLADAIILELSKLKFDNTETILLLQGPMPPKLRGRLLYRGISENLSIWTLTYQPELFRHLEASEHIARCLNSGKNISAVYPPKGIDRASRCWVCRLEEKLFYHFEVITSDWGSAKKEDWEESCERDIQFLLTLDPAYENTDWNPSALGRVLQAVEEQNEKERGFIWFLPQLRDCRLNIKNLNPADPIYNIVKTIDFRTIAANDLFAGEFGGNTDEFPWGDESRVYKEFNNKKHWPALQESLKQHDVV